MANYVYERYGHRVHFNDLAGKPEKVQIEASLSRSLAAFAVEALAHTSAEDAARAVVDGAGDMQIDGIYADQSKKHCWFVQSNFVQSGAGNIPKKVAFSILRGVLDITSEVGLDRGNPRIQEIRPLLREVALGWHCTYSVVLITTTRNPLSADDVNSVRLEVEGQDPGAGHNASIFRFVNMDLPAVRDKAKAINNSRNLVLEMGLKECGEVKSSVHAYYGQIPLADIVRWRKWGALLFGKDIRDFLAADTEVSRSIVRTVNERSELFWYLNNGITIACDRVRKRGPHRDSKSRVLTNIACERASVVNGARTVGTIWRHGGGDGERLDPVSTVLVRVISLEHAPEGFGPEVATATNTQIPVRAKDLIALDEVQQKTAAEFKFRGKTYAYRPPAQIPPGQEGCTADELAAAVACRTSIGLATWTLRNRGALTEREAAPYREAFNAFRSREVDVPGLWLTVRIFRAAGSELLALREQSEGRPAQVATHGRGYLQYRVFQDPRISRLYQNGDDVEPVGGVRDLVGSVVREHHAKVAEHVQSQHEREYLQVLFKNSQRVADTHEKIADRVSTDTTGSRNLSGPNTLFREEDL